VKLSRSSGSHKWSRGFFSDGALRVSGLAEARSGEVLLLLNGTGTTQVGFSRVNLPADSALQLRLFQ
jgi:hypothetical protein